MSIQGLRSRLNQLQREKKQLEKRRKGVQVALKKLKKRPPDDLEDGVKSARKTADGLDDASAKENFSNVIDEIQVAARREFGLGNREDQNALDREIGRLDGEIYDVTEEIKRVKRQIEQERQAALKALLS